MKKIILSLMVITSLAIAESDGGAMYIGLDVGAANVDRTFELKGGGYSYKSSTGNDRTTAGSIKVGFGKFEDNRLEVSLQQYTSNSDSGNSTETLFNSSNTIGVGVDYLITMPTVSPIILPFVKLGVNVSRAKLGFKTTAQYSDEKRDTLYALGGTLGAGVAFQITDFLDVLAGYDYTHRQWQEMSSGPLTLKTTDKVQKLYAGLNLRF
ncbi:MAG: outer membrane beta-barrel protein [Sulfurimonadaceae bacterium]|jgi:opacity protein-like surface antigen|nr:outer membrane beta-barrel protein [Sulfurimonadaceae bacterium]